MNTDFINIPKKDLQGPETESEQYAEEVREAVKNASASERPQKTEKAKKTSSAKD
jgi:hypothetical protein